MQITLTMKKFRLASQQTINQLSAVRQLAAKAEMWKNLSRN